MMDDLDRMLTQLENHDWGPPTYDSHLVTECHRLRNVPLRELDIDGLGTLIGQGIGLKHVVPVALDTLRDDPWAGGDLYPGYLMKTVAEVPAAFWSDHPALIPRFQHVLNTIEERHRFFNKEVLPACRTVFGGTGEAG